MTAPEVHPLPRLHLPAAEVVRLDNGLQLHFTPYGRHPVTSVIVCAECGTAETPQHEALGLAMTLVKEGVGERSATEVARVLDLNGTTLTARADDHWRHWTLSSLSEGLHDTIPLLAEALTQPRYEQASFDTAQRQLIARIQQREHSVDTQCQLLAESAMAPEGHPLRRTPRPEVVEALTRQDVLDVSARGIDPARTHVFVCGNYSTAQRDLITKVFSDLKAPAVALPPLDIRPLKPRPGHYSKTLEGNHQQAAMTLALPIDITRHDGDYSPLRVAVQAFGGYFGSRLNANIRERHGYTYGITAVLLGQPEGTTLSIATQCDPRYCEDVEREVLRELERMAAEPPAGEELARVQRRAALEDATVLEHPFKVNNEVSLPVILGIPDGYYERRQAAAASLTPALIADLWARLIHPSRLISATCQ